MGRNEDCGEGSVTEECTVLVRYTELAQNVPTERKAYKH
jgi:hypothetical protein